MDLQHMHGGVVDAEGLEADWAVSFEVGCWGRGDAARWGWAGFED